MAEPAALMEQDRFSTTVAPRRRQRATAAEIEIRQWLARELHDTVAQVLTGLVIQVERFKLEQAGRRSVLEELEQVQASTREVLTNLRQTMLLLRDEPVTVPVLGEWLDEMLTTFEDETGIEARLEGQRSWPSDLHTHAAINICRIVEEALRNVRLHSRAKSVDVVLTCHDDVARLRIEDDGLGWAGLSDAARHGLGTLGMGERAALLGGEISIDTRPGLGTTVELSLPVERLI